ncbi:CACTA en-spm transposon protein [Cucumis melo var. makuwa]|uniref:CACTA en-spm transposon protein n=1 Tax=Cucumis melo var. makuwa TaxID=1194695 RepID=A0A5A7TK83_CUCMM|nr:CACTA en-spm transposon protein [Cucumis melo var. makuwa]
MWMNRLRMTPCNMSFSNGFDETDALSDFDVDTFNNTGGTSSVGDMLDDSHFNSSTPRRWQHSRNLKLERYFMIKASSSKSFTSHLSAFRGQQPLRAYYLHLSSFWDTNDGSYLAKVEFASKLLMTRVSLILATFPLGCTIGVLTWHTFPICFLKWVDITPEYIELRKGRLHIMLDFTDPTLTRFVEHQMLNTWKAFRGENHRHYKKFSDPEQARANPPLRLKNRVEDWHFLCNHYAT